MIDGWGTSMAAAAVLDATGATQTRGPIETVRRIASVTKLLTAYATLIEARVELHLGEAGGQRRPGIVAAQGRRRTPGGRRLACSRAACAKPRGCPVKPWSMPSG